MTNDSTKLASLAIRGGVVVNSDWSGQATVLVDDGRIHSLLSPNEQIPSWIDRIIDAEGKLVIPGGVDPHCHVNVSVGEFSTRDDYTTTSIAALYGGTTTIVDFAIPAKGQRPLDAVSERHEMARDSRCSVALHGCIVDWDETMPDQLDQMAASGVRTIKLFTTYKEDMMAEPETIHNVMRELRRLGGLAYVHAEADHLVRSAQDQQAQIDNIAPRDHALTRPPLTESVAVAQVLAIAETLKAPVYFVHLTTPESVGLVREARRRGVAAYSETCPHYLLLDESSYAGLHPEHFVCCPPLRSPEDVAALRELAVAGIIDTIGSDNCCYDSEQKSSYPNDTRKTPSGMPGVETRMPLLYSELVNSGGMSPESFVSLTSTNPARLNGIYPRKGVLMPGSDADVVLFDPHLERTIDSAADLHMPTDWTPFASMTVRGWPTTVVTKGRVVLDDGIFNDPGPTGELVGAEPLPDRFVC